ncbi:helix-turn-helix transcriptional regulator [Gallibacterium anatis]|uniref:helix-turn-helix transcriptional regulator n=1 Tax=Gallibacterium anatis TaxID=750 RepID=UPI0006923182|nr:helix-turn-helix domain-containing protein [Gallibacterium anatis]
MKNLAKYESNSIISIDDLAKVMGVTKPTLRNYYRTGKFPEPIKIGKREYWHKSTVEQFFIN